MNLKITPARLSGRVEAVASKSFAHRLLICDALSGGKTGVLINAVSDDIDKTAQCVKKLSLRMKNKTDCLIETELDCGESGSTLRFLLPVAAAIGGKYKFTGKGRLFERPIKPLTDELEKHGVSVEITENSILLDNKLSGGEFFVPGNISSQYITGLMLALPLIGGGKITLESPLASSGYVDITKACLEKFGVTVAETENQYTVSGAYCPPENENRIVTEGDWSNAAFWFATGALGGEIEITGLDINSVQGDREIEKICRKFGASVEVNGQSFIVKSRSAEEICVDCADIPDLVPVLSVLACGAMGKSRLNNISRLRLKESDRVKSVTELVNSLGGSCTADENTMIINGTGRLKGGIVDSHNDHRIVMAAAVAAGICDGSVIIKNAQAVNKSYPSFFKDFVTMGGRVDVI